MSKSAFKGIGKKHRFRSALLEVLYPTPISAFDFSVPIIRAARRGPALLRVNFKLVHDDIAKRPHAAMSGIASEIGAVRTENFRKNFATAKFSVRHRLRLRLNPCRLTMPGLVAENVTRGVRFYVFTYLRFRKRENVKTLRVQLIDVSKKYFYESFYNLSNALNGPQNGDFNFH